ncbi:MAG: PQ-loop repeat-containing protein [Candidatus Omnitrophica bacterium]|nr:PQ-loop repeat-containing protein [Candidatus Omnitrophota bacterium]
MGRKVDMDQVLGWIATTLFTICYIPQMLKTYRTKTVDGLSFRLLFISFIANIVALCYATLIKQQPLQIKYTLAMVFLGGCIYLYLKVYLSKRVKTVNT